MTTWFVSRHPGAIEWATRRGIAVDHQVKHLQVERVAPGDTVIGTLPVHIAAAVCEKGARFLHLQVDVPSSSRGLELSANELEQLGAHLQAFHVTTRSTNTAEDA